MELRVALVVPLLAAAVAVSLVACKKRAEPTTTTTTASEQLPGRGVDPALLGAFQPLPEVAASTSNPVTDEKVALGRMLYFDERLSKNHDLSCESCHHLGAYGVDGEPTSLGHRGQRGARNAPTVYNAAIHFRQFWDGRARDVEEQAKGPMMNPVEMAMPNEALVVKTLRSMPGYVAAFQTAFPADKEPVTIDNASKAIGAFERRLVLPSRWDEPSGGRRTRSTPPSSRGSAASWRSAARRATPVRASAAGCTRSSAP